MPRRSLCIYFSILFLLTSCTGAGTFVPTLIGPKGTPNLNSAPSPTPESPTDNIPASTAITPIPPSSTELPQSGFIPPLYTLNARLDYAAHTLAVDESIFYQNATGEMLTALVLAVEPNIWAGCFVLEYLIVNGQEVAGQKIVGDRLDVPLSAPLIPGGTLNLSLHFDLHLPPADDYNVFGYNIRQINLVDWYPFIVPYSGGWLLHPPADVGEHLAYDVADFDVTLSQVGQTTPVTIAASAAADKASGSLHYRLQNVRTFVFSASTAYQTISTTTDGVIVTSYYFDQEETSANAVLDATVKALKTFGDLFGPYPHTSLSIVESPFFDGMEYDGLFFLSRDFYTSYDGNRLNNLIDIAVHETAHQWWFGLVGNDQAMAPWLDEAMATYSEELFYEKNYPQISTWWSFRVEDFGPSGWVDTDIYHGKNFRTYANAVYLRGAQFLEALRGRIGDQAFFTFLKDYAAQMSEKRATADDFFRILRTHSSVDIADIISSYFLHQY